ncbi:MAG: YjbE family putative metal transport protein [Pseudomonadota bacterium]
MKSAVGGTSMLEAVPNVADLMASLQAELANITSPEWWRANAWNIWNIIVIDVVLAGDNAIVVGLAASRVAPHMRSKVIFWGIAGAVILRIFFALITAQLLQIIGILVIGGLLLLWVCWKMYREIAAAEAPSLDDVEAGLSSERVPEGGYVGFWTAIVNIVIADVSMSLDNVLAVAGAAKGSNLVLVFGLAVAIVLMAVASHFIARLLVRYPWISWVGLLIILYVALSMIYEGGHKVACAAYAIGCEETLASLIKASVFGN